jgi:AraC family transcriptional regulator, transcriptional activator FtrA
MSRRIRWTAYAAALLLPPLAMGGIRMRELATRARPALLPDAVAGSAGLPTPPPYDPAKPTVAVLLGADVTEIIDALGPYEMFARAGRYNVYTVAPERRPTLLSGGLRILPHYSLAELDARLAGRGPAIVVVPNIPNIGRPENRPLLAWMRRQAAAGATMHSWCTGAMALAEAGLLDGRTATAHWGDLDRLAERYPRVHWVRGVRWVDHGTLITSAGLTSGVDASLRVLRRMTGDSVARRVARELRYPNYHFALEPSAPQYAVRPADAVLLANAAFRVGRPQIGLALYDGIGEIDLSALYETHAYTAVADVHTVAAAPGIVRTAHGLTLLPALAPTSAADTAAAGVRRLDRFVVPGRDGRARGAMVAATVAALAPALRPTYLQAEAADRFAVEPALEDVARTADVPTARFAMRRLEYRSEAVRLQGSALPWGVLAPPLALGMAMLPIAFVIDRRSARRRLAIAAAVAALIAPTTVQAQTLDSLAPATRIRVDVRPADSIRILRFGRARPQPVIGTLTAVRGDTLLLAVATGAEPLRVPRSAVDAVYASRGRPPRWKSALRSAVVPALAGAAVRGLVASARRGEGDPAPARAALSGAAMSAAFAAAKGALFPKERWHRVSLPVIVPADSPTAARRDDDGRAPGTPR